MSLICFYKLERQEEIDLKTKKVLITILLVEESIEKSNEEIEEEIFEELSKGLPKIPWFKSVEKVTVTGS